ncbi:hypothetical protein ABIE53_004815 [Burkholderia sp. OAS925]
MFTAFDYAVMAVIGLSALRGTWRGFLSEVFGLIGWIAAFFIACRFVGYVVPYIPSTWPGGALTQWLLAFALVAIGVVLVASVLNALLSRIVQASGLSGVDRSLGFDVRPRTRGRSGADSGRPRRPDRTAPTGILAQRLAAAICGRGRARNETAASGNARCVRPRVTIS